MSKEVKKQQNVRETKNEQIPFSLNSPNIENIIGNFDSSASIYTEKKGTCGDLQTYHNTTIPPLTNPYDLFLLQFLFS